MKQKPLTSSLKNAIKQAIAASTKCVFNNKLSLHLLWYLMVSLSVQKLSKNWMENEVDIPLHI